MPDDPVILDYLRPLDPEPPANSLADASRTCTCIASGGGLFLLGLFVLTGLPGVAMLGFFWILIGGVIAGMGFLYACTYAVIALKRGFPIPATQSKVLWTILISLVPIPVAAFCIIVAIGLLRTY